jgi:hypothetical protein
MNVFRRVARSGGEMFARLLILTVLLGSVVVVAAYVARHVGARGPGGDNAAVSLDEFTDGQWGLRVDRAWDGLDGGISFPSDPLAEDDYEPVSGGPVYPIVVTDLGSRVAVGATPLEGARSSTDGDRIVFELSEGTFAGGRFAVWGLNHGLQAELTIYGSGRPIVKSERGSLIRQRLSLPATYAGVVPEGNEATP